MIKKFLKINNIGSSQHFCWNEINPLSIPDAENPGVTKLYDSKFRKFNILYGENGTGKTTLVKILKSLHFDDEFYLKRNWDREAEDRSVDVEIDSPPNVLFSEASGWQNNILKDRFIFFDKQFIDDYVYSFPVGREVGHDKQTGKLILYLGDFASYQQQLQNLNGLRSNLVNNNGKLKEDIDRRLGILTQEFEKELLMKKYSQFEILENDALPNLNNLHEQKESLEDEIRKIGIMLSREQEVKNLESLNEFSTYKLSSPQEISDSFNFSVGTGTVQVIDKIKGKENFIYKGVTEVVDGNLNQCPFCEQSILDHDKYLHIIQEYEKVFDSEFIELQGKTERTLKEYKDDLIRLSQFSQPIDNQTKLAKLNNLLSSSEILPEMALSKNILDIINGEIFAIDNKISNIFQKGSSNYNDVSTILNEINALVVVYNESVRRINSLLFRAKADLAAGDLNKKKDSLQNKLDDIILGTFVLKNLDDLKDLSELNKQYSQNENVIEHVSQLLRQFIDKVKVRFKEFSEKYFAEIERYASIFCPALKLAVVSSRSTYDLRADDVLCGFEVHYKGHDRLSELSEGEKQAIALAFFFSYLNRDPNKKEKIVVFDDPITSFDAGRRKMCAEYILKESLPYLQVFILTCDPLFRYYCRKTISRSFGSALSSYYVLRSASSAIHFRNKEQTTIYSIFKSDFRSINNVAGTDENIIIYGQKLRYCLEEVKDKYLGYNNDSFSNILEQVKSSNFTKLKNSIDELQEIYSYCNTGGLAHYPRDGQTSWDELRMYVRRYLRLGV